MNRLALPGRIGGLGEIAERFAAGLFDLWGTLYDGDGLFPQAVQALERFCDRGRVAILLSNSPQREERIARRLHRLGLDPALHAGLVTSGEMARRILERDWQGRRFFHLGPKFDRPTVEGMPLEEVDQPHEADLLLATGPVHERIEDHLPVLREGCRAGAVMLVANPDRWVIHRGRKVACAGLLGDLYAEIGGTIMLAGKPGPAIYQEAFRRIASAAGAAVARRKILAIGDGMETDIAGARAGRLPSLFVEGGLHASQLVREGMEHFFAHWSWQPDWRIDRLRW